MPEGFAQPAHEQKKPFSVQSFLMRELCDNGLKGQFLNEIVAYLPVRTTITAPVQVTFELRPTPHIDAQVQHL
uniref:Uncharacterized protein n=1 Tax=Acrobeloides nanus TaxID=290746 RepID=A0A914BZX1_9BILA